MTGDEPLGETDEVTVDYTKADSYTKIQANNASVRAQPRGDLKIDFELNYYPLPDTETFEVLEDGRFGERIGFEGDDDVLVDELQASVLLGSQAAFDLAAGILSEIVSDPRNPHNPLPQEEVSNVLMNVLMTPEGGQGPPDPDGGGRK